MADPRLNGNHLNAERRAQYDATIDELLDERGPTTSDADPLAPRPTRPQRPACGVPVPVGGSYMLVKLDDGCRQPLRVGINTLGRARDNDLILRPIWISRRHCAILVHAGGGCEVYDTASRHGVWVNGRRVDRVELHPGDLLVLTNQRFRVVWFGPDGGVFGSAGCSETARMGELSSTA